MNDKIFELQQELIKTQDSFKGAIMSEPDAEKHADIIAKNSKDEEKLSEKIAKEIEKLGVEEEQQEERNAKKKVLTTIAFFLMMVGEVFSQRTAQVLYVYDGDSFTVLTSGIKTNIRLINADTPEIANKHTGKEAQPFGDVSKEIVKQYINKKAVKIKLYGADKYGRTLAEVWVKDGLKQRALSNILIKNGYAWVNSEYISDAKLNRILLSKQAYAQKNKLGLWADSLAVSPTEWRAKQ